MNLTDILEECRTPAGVRDYAGTLRRLSVEMWQGDGPRDDKDSLPYARGKVLDLSASLLEHRDNIDVLAGGIVTADGGPQNDFDQALNFLLGSAQQRVAAEFSRLQAVSSLINQAGSLDLRKGAIAKASFSRLNRTIETLCEEVKPGLEAIGTLLQQIRELAENGKSLDRFEPAFQGTSAASTPVPEATPAGEPPVPIS